MSEPAQAGLGSWLCVSLVHVYFGVGCRLWHWVEGGSPGSPLHRASGSRWRRGWLMARLCWRIWHHFLPRQLSTSCAEAASEDTGPAASLGLHLFSPPALARNTSPAPHSQEPSSFCSMQTRGLILGKGLDGVKSVAEN